MIGIIVGILLFMFLVLIHELWHFFAAKKAGVHVEEFGIGIPPRAVTLWSDRQWTKYTLNWIPLWWFVRMRGENEDIDESADDDNSAASSTSDAHSFLSASLWWKLVILLAWVAVNALFAWIAFSSAFLKWTMPFMVIPDNLVSIESQSFLMPSVSFLETQWFLSGDVVDDPVIVAEVVPDGLADRVWLQSGDEITTLDGEPVYAHSLPRQLSEYVGAQFILSVVRDGETQELEVTCPDDGCFLGIMIDGGMPDVLPIQFGGVEARKMGAHELYHQTRLTFAMLGQLWRKLFSGSSGDAADAVNSLSGPVGIVKFGEAILTQGGFWMYLAFAGMISLALAIFNILPIPALDGWRTISVLIQAIWRFPRKSYYTIEGYVNFLFFVLLMWLWIYIIFQDLHRFWGISLTSFR